MVRIDVITIFPGLFEAFLRESFVGSAQQRDLLEVRVHDLRDWTRDRHRSVDDSPYGGGPGMLMTPEPLVSAIEAIAGARHALGSESTAAEHGARDRSPDRSPGALEERGRGTEVVLLSPQGSRLDQEKLSALATRERLVLVCGRYEGVDQRVIDLTVDSEISIGDYVLSGGEIPSMVLIEGIARLIPGVLGNPESTRSESYGGDLLEGPQYTRPPIFRGHSVPEVLRSGNHAAIARWREERARERTQQRRPDLVNRERKAPSEPDGTDAERG
jgi:tRNA (guanine37-N1)-methyltransferase